MLTEKEWHAIKKTVKKKDRQRKKVSKKSRREQLDEILAAQEKTNNIGMNYLSTFNIVPKLPAIKPRYVTKFSLVERLLLRLGFLKTDKLLNILDNLIQHLYDIQKEGKDIGDRLDMVSDLKNTIKNL